MDPWLCVILFSLLLFMFETLLNTEVGSGPTVPLSAYGSPIY